MIPQQPLAIWMLGIQVNGEWTFAEQNCSDGSSTTCDSDCPYPFANCNSDESITDLLMSGNWRSQAEAIGHMGVGPETDLSFPIEKLQLGINIFRDYMMMDGLSLKVQ